MHEYAITESIVGLVLEEAKREQAEKVSEIKLVIGELSSIVPECIEMYFEVLSEGTILKGAKLVFINVEAELRCSSCGTKFLKRESGIECPLCGSLGMLTTKGTEFYIESMVIDS